MSMVNIYRADNKPFLCLGTQWLSGYTAASGPGAQSGHLIGDKWHLWTEVTILPKNTGIAPLVLQSMCCPFCCLAYFSLHFIRAPSLQAIRSHCILQCLDKAKYLQMQRSHLEVTGRAKGLVGGQSWEPNSRYPGDNYYLSHADTDNVKVGFTDDDDLARRVRELFLDVRTWDVEAMVEEAILVGLFCTISVKVKSPNYFLPMIKEWSTRCRQT